MSERKWTPGPWECIEVRTSCGRAFRIGAGEMVAGKGKGGCIIYDDYGTGDNARLHNASLIAAAPDLAEAVERLLPLYIDTLKKHMSADRIETLSVVIAARAALSRAKGEAP